MQTCGKAYAFEGLLFLEPLAYLAQHRHLGLGPLDSPATLLGQAEVLHVRLYGSALRQRYLEILTSFEYHFLFLLLVGITATSYYVLLIAYCLSRISRSRQYVVDSCVIRMAACCSLNTSTASRSTLFTDADCELRMPLSRQPRFSVPFVRRLVIYSYVVAMKD